MARGGRRQIDVGAQRNRHSPRRPPRRSTTFIGAIALATDAMMDAEDYGQMARASKIRAQIRAMEAELATLRAAEATVTA